MTLAVGARLGPYEIVSPLGAGGMGEVYRAHDSRLGRDVAVKVIASDGKAPPEQMERFRREARAVAALDHPHILALHDLGSEDGTLFAVFELLEGQTLRQRLQAGPLPVRKSLELALQMCRGLHAAHVRGIAHGDMKPDNVFLTREGHVKVLDFGLAVLHEHEGAPTLSAALDTATPTNAVFPSGTVGYMSPEQLRGEKASPSADLFALGVVCYEMISGKRPFEGATLAESLAAVLTRDPPDLTAAVGVLPPALEPLVRRCLEKDPKERFQSAHDLAFALEAVLGGTAATETRTAAAHKRAPRAWLRAAAMLALVALGLGLGLVLPRPEAPAPAFTQLTFRRGWANFGRFAPDGRTVVYTAAWDGGPPEIYATRTDDRVSRPLGLPHAALLSISPRGELAILLDPHRQRGIFSRGTLATVPLGGGTPHEVLPDVNEADWAPDGRTLAVLRYAEGEQRIECPQGEAIYRSPKGLRLLRVSPDGRRLAFIEGTESHLELVALELDTHRRAVLAEHLPANLFGLAWAPSSREVWLTVGESTAARDVVAVRVDGRRRLVYRSLTSASLLDLAPDGRALLLRGSDRWGTMARARGEETEQDLSIFDFSVPAAVSSDGRTLLLDEFGQAAGPGGAVFVRHAGTQAVRLADGLGLDLSPDGSAALVKSGQPPQLLDVPTGPALPRKLSLGKVSPRWARWVPPSGARLVVLGQEADRPPRLFVVDRAGTSVRPLGPESGVTFFAISPDGSRVATRSTPGSVSLVPIDGGASREITGVADDLAVGSFGADGQSLFLVRTSVGFPCEVHRLDLARGQTVLFKRVAPADPTGISQCSWMNLSPDGESYAYAFYRSYADLMLAEGLK